MGKPNTGYILKLPDKTYKAILEYPPENGKRIRKTRKAKTEGQAKKALNDLVLQRSRYLKLKGTNGDSDVKYMSFNEAADNYISKCKTRVKLKTLAEGTYEDYEAIVEQLKVEFGIDNIYEITSDDFDDYFNKLIIKEKMAPSSVVKKRVILNNIYKSNKIDLKPLNETEPIANSHKRNLDKINPLSDDEMEKLEAYLYDAKEKYKGHKNNSDWMMYFIYFFTLATGCREGEVAGLKISSLCREDNMIKIDNSITTLKKVGIKDKKPKTYDSDRFLLVNEDVFKLLDELFKIYEDYDYPNSEYVFRTRNGTAFFPRNLLKYFVRACKEAKLTKKHTFHDIRHTNITVKIGSGIDVKTVSIMAGHSDTKVTLDTYSHYWKLAAQKAANLDKFKILQRKP